MKLHPTFLLSQVKIDIVPDKGWARDDMFVSPGYHINAEVTGGSSAPHEAGATPFTYTGGAGNVLMNGCYGTNYQPRDPCYRIKVNSTFCKVRLGYAQLWQSSEGLCLSSFPSKPLNFIMQYYTRLL